MKSVKMKGIKLKDTQDETSFIVSLEVKFDSFEGASEFAKSAESKIRNLIDGQTTLDEQ